VERVRKLGCEPQSIMPVNRAREGPLAAGCWEKSRAAWPMTARPTSGYQTGACIWLRAAQDAVKEDKGRSPTQLGPDNYNASLAGPQPLIGCFHVSLHSSGAARDRDDRALAGENGSRGSKLNVLESTQRSALPENLAFPEIPRSHFDQHFFSFTEFSALVGRRFSGLERLSQASKVMPLPMPKAGADAAMVGRYRNRRLCGSTAA
jgi:hypothetical protein